jgi:hypothetical protein
MAKTTSRTAITTTTAISITTTTTTTTLGCIITGLRAIPSRTGSRSRAG